MTVKELKLGIEEMLKKHPDWENYQTYNTFEQHFCEDFAFAPYKNGGIDGEIPEEANVSDWYNQKWFYEVTGNEPDEWVKKHWVLEETHKRILSYVQEKYPGDKIFKYDRKNPTAELKIGDTITSYESSFLGDFPNVAIRLRVVSKRGEKYGSFHVLGAGNVFWAVLTKVLKKYKNEALTYEMKAIIKEKVSEELNEYAGSHDTIRENGFEISGDIVESIDFIPIPMDLGATGMFTVITIEV